MYEIQHSNQHRWESQPRWVLNAQHATLERCVEGVRRIVTPWPGEVARDPDRYRIVKLNARGRIVETYDAFGKQIDGFLKQSEVRAGNVPVRRRPARRKTPVTA